MLVRTKRLKASPVKSNVAAVSAGVIGSAVRLDLDYQEDSAAAVDCNIVMNAKGELIEVQGSAEGRAYTRDQLVAMLDVAAKGIAELVEVQNRALGKG
jgi:ribonuclease PH